MIVRVLVVLVALACVSRPALAGDGSHIPAPRAQSAGDARLIVESHAGPRPEDADLLLPPIRSIMQTQGHALSDAAVERAHARLPLRNPSPPASVVDEMGALFDRGFRHWDDVEFTAAIEVLGQAIDIAREHPRAITESSALRDRLFRAHVVVALAYNRSQEIGAAREAMGELARGFSDRTIPFGQFGPEPETLRQAVEEDLRADGMARMIIRVQEETAKAVFINERFAGAGDEVDVELYPGRYRVFALTDHGPGRIRTIELSPGETRHVDIDPSFDRALRLAPQPALAFTDESPQRRHEIDYALRLAEAAGAEAGAVLLEIRKRAGRRVIHGRTVSADGATNYEAYIEVGDAVPVERLYALGAFLAGEPAGTEVQVVGPPVKVEAPGRGSRFGAWSYVAMGAGAAALSAGAVLWRIDGRGSCSADGRQCPRLYDTRTAGITGVVVGGAALTAGAAAWVYDARRRRGSGVSRAAVAPAPSGGFVMILSGEF